MEKFRFMRAFQNGAVLQREEPISVRGFGAKGEVLIRLEGKESCSVSCMAERDGSFCAVFPPLPGGNAVYRLSAVSGGETISVEDIRIGDVFLLLGQSNMAYPLSAVERREHWREKIAQADVSFLAIREEKEGTDIPRPVAPQKDLNSAAEWVRGSADAAYGFSAIGAIAAASLYASTGIPVGMVDTSMGGLSVEAYLPREYAEQDAVLLEYLQNSGRYIGIEEYNTWGDRNFTQLAGVYNQKIAPLRGMKFRGVVWYLGESSAHDFESARFFARELRKIVLHYRELFGDIPFTAVQIAPEFYYYGDKFGYLYINESLSELSRELNDFTVVPTYFIEPRWLVCDGDTYYHPIHPVNKEPVALAVARSLRNNAVRKKKYSWPYIKETKEDGDGLICRIACAGKGLRTGGLLRGFTVCGEDGKYFAADAQIVAEDSIRLTSRQVPRPVGGTYAFMQYQAACNVRLKTGEYLLPWRSEHETVHTGYYFPPAFIYPERRYTEENCFGYSVGIRRKISSWEQGRIYGGHCRIAFVLRESEPALRIIAHPKNKDYFFFGISPRICLSGWEDCFTKFSYLNVSVCASAGNVEFYGIVVRTSDGIVYRFPVLSGENCTDFVALSETPCRCSVCLGQAYREDGALATFSRDICGTIVEAEFLFRCKTGCSVDLFDLEFARAHV